MVYLLSKRRTTVRETKPRGSAGNETVRGLGGGHRGGASGSLKVPRKHSEGRILEKDALSRESMFFNGICILFDLCYRISSKIVIPQQCLVEWIFSFKSKTTGEPCSKTSAGRKLDAPTYLRVLCKSPVLCYPQRYIKYMRQEKL